MRQRQGIQWRMYRSWAIPLVWCGWCRLPTSQKMYMGCITALALGGLQEASISMQTRLISHAELCGHSDREGLLQWAVWTSWSINMGGRWAAIMASNGGWQWCKGSSFSVPPMQPQLHPLMIFVCANGSVWGVAVFIRGFAWVWDGSNVCFACERTGVHGQGITGAPGTCPGLFDLKSELHAECRNPDSMFRVYSRFCPKYT